MNFKRVALLLAQALCVCSVNAASQNPIRTLTVDSGYLQHSARAFWRFGQEVDGAVSTSFDLLHSAFAGSFMLGRLALSGLYYFGWNRLEYGFFVANHELGHGQHFYAAGGSPTYTWATNGSEQSNAILLWAHGFTHYNDGAFTSGGWNNAPTDYSFITSAAGMNNSNQYAEAIENQISYGGGGHILQYLGYVRGKGDGAEYVRRTTPGKEGDDVQDTLSYFSGKGYGISSSDISTGSNVARWASATHWLFVVDALRYIWSGDPIVKPVALGGVKLPDVSHYLSTYGVSYVVRSGFLRKDFFLPMNVEYVYKGETTVEGTLGYRSMKDGGKGEGGYGMNLVFNSRGGYGLSGDFSTRLAGFSLGFGGSYFSAKSILGERVIQRYLSGAAGGYDLWAKVSFQY